MTSKKEIDEIVDIIEIMYLVHIELTIHQMLIQAISKYGEKQHDRN
jgi:hypothetical protein